MPGKQRSIAAADCQCRSSTRDSHSTDTTMSLPVGPHTCLSMVELVSRAETARHREDRRSGNIPRPLPDQLPHEARIILHRYLARRVCSLPGTRESCQSGSASKALIHMHCRLRWLERMLSVKLVSSMPPSRRRNLASGRRARRIGRRCGRNCSTSLPTGDLSVSVTRLVRFIQEDRGCVGPCARAP